jgi:Co/Zn/Cd efflux system component
MILSIYETNCPPEFQITFDDWKTVLPSPLALSKQVTVTTIRPNGIADLYSFKPMINKDGLTKLQSTQSIPEPHEFHCEVRMYPEGITNAHQIELYSVDFHESSSSSSSSSAFHEIEMDENSHHPLRSTGTLTKSGKEKKQRQKLKYEEDNNFRAAMLHVIADAFVSVVTIVAITIAGTVPKAWFLNPLVGIIGSLVIVSWAVQLIYDTAGSLLDISPDPTLNEKLKKILEADGVSHVVDLHIWKLGPGKLGMIASLATSIKGRGRNYYWNKLKKYKPLSHVTIEIYDDVELTGSSPSSTARGILSPLQIDHGHNHGHSH